MVKNCEKFCDPTNKNSTCHNDDRHSHKLTGWYHTGPLPIDDAENITSKPHGSRALQTAPTQ